MLGFLIALAVIGLIAGAIARLLVPGPDRIGCLGTMLLGVAGSYVGGFLAWLIWDRDTGRDAIGPSGLLGSVVGAVLVLLLYRWSMGTRSRRP